MGTHFDWPSYILSFHCLTAANILFWNWKRPFSFICSNLSQNCELPCTRWHIVWTHFTSSVQKFLCTLFLSVNLKLAAYITIILLLISVAKLDFHVKGMNLSVYETRVFHTIFSPQVDEVGGCWTNSIWKILLTSVPLPLKLGWQNQRLYGWDMRYTWGWRDKPAGFRLETRHERNPLG